MELQVDMFRILQQHMSRRTAKELDAASSDTQLIKILLFEEELATPLEISRLLVA